MFLLKELMSDWVGLLSLITILAVLVMGAYYAWLFSRNMDAEARAGRSPKAPTQRRRHRG